MIEKSLSDKREQYKSKKITDTFKTVYFYFEVSSLTLFYPPVLVHIYRMKKVKMVHNVGTAFQERIFISENIFEKKLSFE